MSLKQKQQGSVLIWTLVLGIGLTMVFFLFAQRLNANTYNQRQNTAYLDSQGLLKSYADYIQALPKADLQGLKGSIDFEGITGILTDETEEITGYVDPGMSVQYDFSGDIKIKWNLCGADNLKADLTLVNAGLDVLHSHQNTPCPPGGYDDEVDIVGVSNPFSIKSVSLPFYYSITSTDPNTKLLDNTWTLTLEMALESGKKISITRSFVPSP